MKKNTVRLCVAKCKERKQCLEANKLFDVSAEKTASVLSQTGLRHVTSRGTKPSMKSLVLIINGYHIKA